MNYRKKGKVILSSILKLEKNIEIIEKKIYKITKNDKEKYFSLLYECATDLKINKKIGEIIKKLDNKKIEWDNKIFDNYRFELKEQDDFINKPFEVDEGVIECNKCGSNKTYSFSKQTRSGDEATTVFSMCSECGSKWKT